jgi:hypothetical protein
LELKNIEKDLIKSGAIKKPVPPSTKGKKFPNRKRKIDREQS